MEEPCAAPELDSIWFVEFYRHCAATAGGLFETVFVPNPLKESATKSVLKTRTAWRLGYLVAALGIYLMDQASKAWAVRRLRFEDRTMPRIVALPSANYRRAARLAAGSSLFWRQRQPSRFCSISFAHPEMTIAFWDRALCCWREF